MNSPRNFRRIFFKILLTLIVILAIVVASIVLPTGNIEMPADNSKYKLPEVSEASASVEVMLLKTASATTLTALTMAQGALFEPFEIMHGAVLVKHGEDSFLFDSGLGREAQSQFDQDMEAYLKPLMTFEMGTPVFDQINNSDDLPYPQRIFLSHTHWDHLSGAVDFPDIEVWLPSEELSFVEASGSVSIFPSQVNSPNLTWHEFEFSAVEYAGFQKSYDIFGDSSAVLVQLHGHTPGSVGLFVNSSDGTRHFFVGDAVWNIDAIKQLRKKFWFASNIVDHDKEAVAEIVRTLYLVQKQNPELKIIPSHDTRVWQ